MNESWKLVFWWEHLPIRHSGISEMEKNGISWGPLTAPPRQGVQTADVQVPKTVEKLDSGEQAGYHTNVFNIV